MLSILGRLLCDELGVNKYSDYYDNYADNKNREIIFCDIYKELEDKDIYTLHNMLERLLGAVELSVRINKQFVWVVAGTVLTIISLIMLPAPVYATVIGIFIVSVCFIYKGIVYILNRFSYVDTNITLLYKTALFHRIMTYNIRRLARKGEE